MSIYRAYPPACHGGGGSSPVPVSTPGETPQQVRVRHGPHPGLQQKEEEARVLVLHPQGKVGHVVYHTLKKVSHVTIL